MTTALTIFLTIITLSLIKKITTKQEQKQDKNQFVLSYPMFLFWLAVVEILIMMGLMIWIYLSGDLTWIPMLFVLGLASLGVVMILVALPGSFEIRINNDEIVMVKFFKKRKTYHFSDIEKAMEYPGNLKVFVKNRKKAAFSIDQYMIGSNLFRKRLREAEIPIED